MVFDPNQINDKLMEGYSTRQDDIQKSLKQALVAGDLQAWNKAMESWFDYRNSSEYKDAVGKKVKTTEEALNLLIDLSNVKVEGKNLSGFQFDQVNLAGATFKDCKITGTSEHFNGFTHSNLTDVTFENCEMRHVRFNSNMMVNVSGFDTSPKKDKSIYEHVTIEGSRINGLHLAGNFIESSDPKRTNEIRENGVANDVVLTMTDRANQKLNVNDGNVIHIKNNNKADIKIVLEGSDKPYDITQYHTQQIESLNNALDPNKGKKDFAYDLGSSESKGIKFTAEDMKMQTTYPKETPIPKLHGPVISFGGIAMNRGDGQHCMTTGVCTRE